MDGFQQRGSRTAAVTVRRAFTVLELIVVCAVFSVLALAVVIPQYAGYTRARQVGDAAAILSGDIAYLERFAQNSEPFEGATIEVESDDPLAYTCYSGRPSSFNPQWRIRDVLIVRSFDDVALVPGALHRGGPLLFAHNGSVQYITGNQWADQHAPVTIELRSRTDRSRLASVLLNPFTGAVSTGD